MRVFTYWQHGNQNIGELESLSWLAIKNSLITYALPSAFLYSFARLPKITDTSVYTPIWHNHAFPPSITDKAFKELSQNGIITVNDLYINKQFASFVQM